MTFFSNDSIHVRIVTLCSVLLLASCTKDSGVIVSGAPPTGPSSFASSAPSSSSSPTSGPPVSIAITAKENHNRRNSAVGQLCWAIQQATILGGEVGIDALRSLPPQSNGGTKPVLPGLPAAAVAAKFKPLIAEIKKIDSSAMPDALANYTRYFAAQIDKLIAATSTRQSMDQVAVFSEFLNYDSYPNQAEVEKLTRQSADCNFS